MNQMRIIGVYHLRPNICATLITKNWSIIYLLDHVLSTLPVVALRADQKLISLPIILACHPIMKVLSVLVLALPILFSILIYILALMVFGKVYIFACTYPLGILNGI